MKLPSFRRLFKQDFEQQFQGFVDQLSPTVNTGTEILYDALNKKLNFRDNFQSTVKDITVEIDGSGKPKSATTINFDSGVTGRVDGVFVTVATNLTNSSTYPTGAPFVTFTPTENGISINHIAGLQPNNKYTLRLVILQN